MTTSRKFAVLLVPILFLFFGLSFKAKADDATPTPVTINFEVEGPSGNIYSNQNLLVPACTTQNNASSTVNGFCAFAAAGLPVDVSWFSFGAEVNSINNVAGDSSNFWLWFLNGDAASQGIDSYMLKPGDTVLWALAREPLKVSISNTSPNVNSTSTISVLGFNANNFDFEPVSDASIIGTSLTTDSAGHADIVPTTTAPIIFSVSAAGFINSPQFTVTPLPQAHLVVLSASSATTGQAFTATAEQYDIGIATYTPLTAITLGVLDASSTEVATSTADGSGQATFTLNTAGAYSVGIKDDAYNFTVPIIITAPASPPPGGSGSSGITHTNLNIPNALAFITAAQSPDGSFGSDLVTDWTVMAFGAQDPGAAKTALKNYLLHATPALSNATDYERHAMALEALGINPYTGTPVNYINPIVSAFDGTQIGDKNLDNDDIFSIFPLLNAGYGPGDDIIQKEAAFIVSKQLPDGSWDESPDMTAAAIQALGAMFGVSNVSPQALGQSLGMAGGYLASTEKPDGGWGNVDSTSWVTMEENAAKQGDPAHFVPFVSTTGYFPTDYLASSQQSDGGVTGVNLSSRVWSTGYAVTAASGKSWFGILQPFSKTSSGSTATTGSGSSITTTAPAVATSTATSTLPTLPNPTATSTPAVATTTTPTLSIIFQATTTTSSTPPVIPLPKPKIHKAITKTPPTPQVLGESTNQPQVSATQESSQPASSPPSSRPGFFGTIWHAIGSFLRNLF